MDIASLLSPCTDPSSTSPPHESGGSVDSVEGVSSSALVTTTQRTRVVAESVDQELTPLSHGAQTRTQASGQRRATSKSLAAAATNNLSVKRKRKRRFSAQQKQIMRENEEDDSLVYNLTFDINELKQQVRDLLVRKSIYETRTLVSQQRFVAGVLRTSQHFFQILQDGSRKRRLQEDAFLTATVDEDIPIASGVCGASVLFEQWRQYSKLMEVRTATTSSIRILVSDSESCVVECKGEFEGKLTLAAIEAVFPHILQDTALLSRVVDSRLVCPRTAFLYFNGRGRIVGCDVHADTFAGLNRILTTNPVDVIALMSNARIGSEGGMILELDDDGRVEMVAEDDVDLKAAQTNP